jgi:LEA14-like dessication related protein
MQRAHVFSFLLFFTLSLSLLLAGCATMRPGWEQPTVTVTDLRAGEIKALEAIFILELRVMNPNDFPLDIRGLNCDLKIDGKRFANGLSDVRQEVPAFGTATIPVTVYASMFEMVTSVIRILQETDQRNDNMAPLRYDLAGKIRLEGQGTVPFESRGELDLSGQGGR